MLSALILSRRCYPAVPLGGTTGAQEVCPARSSRTSAGSPQISTPTTDRDRTVSRRSEPSSRATLIGEQPNPWDLLQPRDVTSRHRGAKPLRRYELLGGISLLSPEYLLSFERRPSMRNRRITMLKFPSCSTCLSRSQAPLCHCTLRLRLPIGLRAPLEPPLRFWRRPPQSNYPPSNVRASSALEAKCAKAPYFNSDSSMTGVTDSQSPDYPTHRTPGPQC